MATTIKYLIDLFRRSPRSANTPEIPQPGSVQSPTIQQQGVELIERHHQPEFIRGMNISLDPEERAMAVNSELVTMTQQPRLVLGCSCVVSRIGPPDDRDDYPREKTDNQQSSKDECFQIAKSPESPTRAIVSGFNKEMDFHAIRETQAPKKYLAGICKFCREEAMTLVKKQQLVLSQVDLYCTYCNYCERTCGICHTNTCDRHNLDYKNPDDGTPVKLCPACQTDARRQRLSRGIFQSIASLFLLQEPSSKQEQKQDEVQTF